MKFDGIGKLFYDFCPVLFDFQWNFFDLITFDIWTDSIHDDIEMFAHCDDVKATAHKVCCYGGQCEAISKHD